MADVLAGENRVLAGPTAPAKGLFLVKVDYGDQDRALNNFPNSASRARRAVSRPRRLRDRSLTPALGWETCGRTGGKVRRHCHSAAHAAGHFEKVFSGSFLRHGDDKETVW